MKPYSHHNHKHHWHGYRPYWRFGGKWMPWLGIGLMFWLFAGGFKFVFTLIPLFFVGAFLFAAWRYMDKRKWDWDRAGKDLGDWGDKMGRWSDSEFGKAKRGASTVSSEESPKRKNGDDVFYV